MDVLLAEDDAATRMLLRAIIDRLGHRCIDAEDGEVAWQAFVDHEPDVVITDRHMPGLSGTALCRRIREHPRGMRTSIILVTGDGGAADVIDGVAAGADDYLVKPVEEFVLQVRLLAAERVARLHRQLEEASDALVRKNVELQATARTDALTGVGNRRRFEEDLAATHADAQRSGAAYAVAIVDVDHFKRYNDDFGHQAGDAALEEVARALVGTSRLGDMVYRYGGEEFVVIYRHGNPPAVAAAAERARAAVAAIPIAGPDGGVLARAVTVSVGLAWPSIPASPSSDPADVLAAADAALYRAKAGGRDRLVVMADAEVDGG